MLWWNFSQYVLGQAFDNIEELQLAIANNLPGLGYTGVQNSALGLGGNKDGLYLGVMYLLISGREYWQVIACGGTGTEAQAQADLETVGAMINTLGSFQ